MKIVGFLQNCWFPKDTKPDYIEKYLNDDVFRRRVLARGWTGRRLINAFGEKLFHEIIWDNASIEVGNFSGYCGDADIDHIEDVIEKHKPKLILTFGRVASQALFFIKEKNKSDFAMLCTKHPSARGFKNNELLSFASRIVDKIKEIENESIHRIRMVQ